MTTPKDLLHNKQTKLMMENPESVPIKSQIESAASMRDIDVLKRLFFEEFGCDTNDILTLYTYW